MEPSVRQLLDIIETQNQIVRLGLDLQGVMVVVAERAATATGASGASVELVEQDRLVCRAATGAMAGAQGSAEPLGSSFAARAIRERSPLRLEDAGKDAEVPSEEEGRPDARSVGVVPIFHDQEAVGVLKVTSGERGAFAEADMTLLQLLASLIEASVHQARRMSESEMFHRVARDEATGLATRALFIERVHRAILEARRVPLSFGVLTVDVRDTGGIAPQPAEDAPLLREVARRVSSCIREVDTAARVGRSSFAVLLRHVDDREGVERVLTRLRTLLSQPYEGPDLPRHVDVRLGTALFPLDGATVSDLLDHARG